MARNLWIIITEVLFRLECDKAWAANVMSYWHLMQDNHWLLSDATKTFSALWQLLGYSLLIWCITIVRVINRLWIWKHLLLIIILCILRRILVIQGRLIISILGYGYWLSNNWLLLLNLVEWLLIHSLNRYYLWCLKCICLHLIWLIRLYLRLGLDLLS